MSFRSCLNNPLPVAAGVAPVGLAETRSGVEPATSTAPAASRTWSFSSLLAPDDGRRPAFARRLAVFPLLFIPWLILYESVVKLGPPPNAVEGYLSGEIHWPIFQWMELFYVSPYVLVTLVPFVVTTNRSLRRFTLAGVLATVIGHLVFLAVPIVATPRPFEPHGLLGAMMLLDRRLDLYNGTAAFPSFHVFWAFLGASAFADRWPRWRQLGWLWAVAVSLSCVFTGMHSAVDILGGFGLYLLTSLHQPVRQWIDQIAVRLGQLPTAGFGNLVSNVVILMVMLNLGRHSVPLAVILKFYLLLWILARFAWQSTPLTVATGARRSFGTQVVEPELESLPASVEDSAAFA